MQSGWAGVLRRAALFVCAGTILSGWVVLPTALDDIPASSRGATESITRSPDSGKRSEAVARVAARRPVAGTAHTALIVGINHAAGSSALFGALTDAHMLARALRSYGYADVTVLEERAASRRAILEALDELAARTSPDGRAVFAFAGHTRKRGGVDQLVAADGRLIPATLLAQKLSRVKAPLWSTFPTCYAAGYALPGIVGPGRLATFASSAGDLAYEIGARGSYLMIHMVGHAMLDGRGSTSVERAFASATVSIRRVNPAREPIISDGIKGEFLLTRPDAPRAVVSAPGLKGSRPATAPPGRRSPHEKGGRSGEPPDEHHPLVVCGPVRVNCSP